VGDKLEVNLVIDSNGVWPSVALFMIDNRCGVRRDSVTVE